MRMMLRSVLSLVLLAATLTLTTTAEEDVEGSSRHELLQDTQDYATTTPATTTTTTTTTTTPATTTTTKSPTDCEVAGRTFPDGFKVEGAGTACQSCFCLRGTVTCTNLTCAQPIDGCKPIMQEGRCCPVMYDCGGEVTQDQLALLLKAKALDHQDELLERQNMARMSPSGEATITDIENDKSPVHKTSIEADPSHSSQEEASATEITVTEGARTEEDTEEEATKVLTNPEENLPQRRKPIQRLRPLTRPSHADIAKRRQQSRFSVPLPTSTRISRPSSPNQPGPETQTLSERIRNRSQPTKYAAKAKTTLIPTTSELTDTLLAIHDTQESSRSITLPITTTKEPFNAIKELSSTTKEPSTTTKEPSTTTNELANLDSTKTRSPSSLYSRFRYSIKTTTPKPATTPRPLSTTSTTTVPVITTLKPELKSRFEVTGVGHVGDAFLLQDRRKLTTFNPPRRASIFNRKEQVEVGTGVTVKGSAQHAMPFGPILIFDNRVRTDRKQKATNVTDSTVTTTMETKEEDETAVTDIPIEETTLLAKDIPIEEEELNEESITSSDALNESEPTLEELTTVASLLDPDTTIKPEESPSTTTQSTTTTTITTTTTTSSTPEEEDPSPTSPSVDDTSPIEEVVDTDYIYTETDLPTYDITVGTSVMASNHPPPGVVGVGEVIPVDLEPEHKASEADNATEAARPSLLGTLLNILTRPDRPTRPRPETQPDTLNADRTIPERPNPQTPKPETSKPERPNPERTKPETPNAERTKPERQNTDRTRPERLRPERPLQSFRPRPRPNTRPEFVPPRFRFTPPPPLSTDDLTTQSSVTSSTQELEKTNRPAVNPSPFLPPPNRLNPSHHPVLPAFVQSSPTQSDHTPIHLPPISLINLPDPIHTRPKPAFSQTSAANLQSSPALGQPGPPADLPSEPIIEGGFQGIRGEGEGIQPTFDLSDDYDTNGEPTLPPSLPNLKIIPFVAADALTKLEHGFSDEDTHSSPRPLVPIFIPDAENDQISSDSENVAIENSDDVTEAATSSTPTTTRRTHSRLPIGDRRNPLLPPRRTIIRPVTDESFQRRPFLPFRRPAERPIRPYHDLLSRPISTEVTSPEIPNTMPTVTPKPHIPLKDLDLPETHLPFLPPSRPPPTTLPDTTTMSPADTTLPPQLPPALPPRPKTTTIIPIQSSRPEEIPLQNSRPVEIPTQNSRPVEIPTQNNRPVEFHLQNSRPVEIPTQNSRPVEIPTQNSRPIEIPTQNSRPIEIPPQNSRPNSRPVVIPTQNSRPIVSNDIANLLLQDIFDLPEGQNPPPVRFGPNQITPKPIVPVKIASSLPEIPPAVRDQLPLATDPVLASGLLKLSGCNIYGRMYVVKDRIPELSAKCKECRCTPVGVQCLPIC